MKIFKRILAGLALLLVLAIGWGLIEPYFIDVEEYEVEIPRLPPEWEGQRFAQVSDWQLGMWMDNDRTVRRAVERLVEERPAFVLISGDFIYDARKDPDGVVEEAIAIARLLPDAGIPTYAVLGNHDYAMSKRDSQPDDALAERLTAALEEAGVEVLQNEAVPLRLRGGDRSERNASGEGGALHLVGIGANWPGRDEPVAAFGGLAPDAARVVMMHNPNSFETIPAGAAPLAVAGHTHGGQISIPFTPDWSYLTYARSDEVHADSWIETSYGNPGNQLYVNRGIGFSGVPLRIHCTPEVTLFTLTSAGS